METVEIKDIKACHYCFDHLPLDYPFDFCEDCIICETCGSKGDLGTPTEELTCLVCNGTGKLQWKP